MDPAAAFGGDARLIEALVGRARYQACTAVLLRSTRVSYLSTCVSVSYLQCLHKYECLMQVPGRYLLPDAACWSCLYWKVPARYFELHKEVEYLDCFDYIDD